MPEEEAKLMTEENMKIHKALAKDTYESLSMSYYGSKDYASKLASYNGLAGKLVSRKPCLQMHRYDTTICELCQTRTCKIVGKFIHSEVSGRFHQVARGLLQARVDRGQCWAIPSPKGQDVIASIRTDAVLSFRNRG